MTTSATTANNINDFTNDSFSEFDCEEKWIYTDDNSLMEKPIGSMDRTVIVSDIIKDHYLLSKEAKKFIVEQFEESAILRIRETMEPDGYCEDGPEAEIWELLVQTKDKKVYSFSYYHFWSNGERQGYTLDE